MTAALILGVLSIGVACYFWFKGSQSPINHMRNGSYGSAAMYREWRLAAEQHEANTKGCFGRNNFSRG